MKNYKKKIKSEGGNYLRIDFKSKSKIIFYFTLSTFCFVQIRLDTGSENITKGIQFQIDPVHISWRRPPSFFLQHSEPGPARPRCLPGHEPVPDESSHGWPTPLPVGLTGRKYSWHVVDRGWAKGRAGGPLVARGGLSNILTILLWLQLAYSTQQNTGLA